MKRSSCVFARGSLRGSLCPSLSSWQPIRGFTIASSAFNTTTEPQINFIFPARTGMKRLNTRESMEVCAMASSCRYFLSGRCKGRGPFSYAKRIFHSSTTKPPTNTSRCCSTTKQEEVIQQPHVHHHDHAHDCHTKFGTSPKCWSCDKFLIRSSLFCSSCHKVQPLQDYNSFEVLGMPKEFDIDLKLLEKHYWALQRRVHPDLFHQKSKIEKDYSAVVSSHLNDAYNTLKHPDRRAKYMLQMAGEDVSEEQRIDNPELLMEVLDTRSQIDEAHSQEELKSLEHQNKDKLAWYYKQLAAAFKQQKFEEAKKLVAELQYYVKIKEEITNRLH